MSLSVVVKIAPMGTRTRICNSRVRRSAGLSIPGRNTYYMSCSVFILHCAYSIALSMSFHYISIGTSGSVAQLGVAIFLSSCFIGGWSYALLNIERLIAVQCTLASAPSGVCATFVQHTLFSRFAHCFVNANCRVLLFRQTARALRWLQCSMCGAELSVYLSCFYMCSSRTAHSFGEATRRQTSSHALILFCVPRAAQRIHLWRSAPSLLLEHVLLALALLLTWCAYSGCKSQF